MIPRIDTPRNPSETLKLRRASGRPVFPILGLKPFAASRFSAFMRLSESGIGTSAFVRRRIVAPAGAAFMQSASVAPQPGIGAHHGGSVPGRDERGDEHGQQDDSASDSQDDPS